jgi:hypothetical protein
MYKFCRQIARILVNQDYRQGRGNRSCSKPVETENSKREEQTFFSDTTLTRCHPENIPQKHLPEHIIQHSVKTKTTIHSAAAAMKTYIRSVTVPGHTK